MSNPNTQVIGDSSQSDKAQWDTQLTTAFVDICVDRHKAGDRPNTHFTKEGRKKIITTFKEKTGKSYDQTQLKNKWDNLKKEWRLWEKLVFSETGLGWDDQRQTILADSEWWERKNKEDKKCAKFRNQGIADREGLQFLFRGQAATGAHAFNPSATPLDETVGADNQVPDQEERGLEDLLLSQDDDSQDPEYNVNHDVKSSPTPTHTARIGRRSTTQVNRGRRKRKATDVRDEISASLGQLVTVVQSRTSVVNSSFNSADIENVMELLEEFPETSNGGPLLRFALRLFERKEHRDWFLGIGRKKWQLEWLQSKFDEANGGGTAGSI